MSVMFVMSIFWTIYGIAGLLGYQNIPEKYRGHSWTKDLIRCQGKSWLMLGVPWMMVYLAATFVFADMSIKTGTWLIFDLVVAIPGLIYTVIWDRKYKAMLEAETTED